MCFGTTKRTGAALLFFANKWISMSVYVMVLVTFATLPSDKVSSPSLSPCQGISDGYQRFVCSLIVLRAPQFVTCIAHSCSSLVIFLWAAQTLQFVPGAGVSCVQSSAHST